MAPSTATSSSGGGAGGAGAGANSAEDDNFFRATILALARSLARIPRVEWALVRDPLFSQCPRGPGESGWVLTERSQDAALALGVFFLEGGCQCADKVLPYLLRLEGALFEAAIQERRDARESESSRRVCISYHSKKGLEPL